jgi:hypothetical protein
MALSLAGCEGASAEKDGAKTSAETSSKGKTTGQTA